MSRKPPTQNDPADEEQLIAKSNQGKDKTTSQRAPSNTSTQNLKNRSAESQETILRILAVIGSTFLVLFMINMLSIMRSIELSNLSSISRTWEYGYIAAYVGYGLILVIGVSLPPRHVTKQLSSPVGSENPDTEESGDQKDLIKKDRNEIFWPNLFIYYVVIILIFLPAITLILESMILRNNAIELHNSNLRLLDCWQSRPPDECDDSSIITDTYTFYSLVGLDRSIKIEPHDNIVHFTFLFVFSITIFLIFWLTNFNSIPTLQDIFPPKESDSYWTWLVKWFQGFKPYSLLLVPLMYFMRWMYIAKRSLFCFGLCFGLVDRLIIPYVIDVINGWREKTGQSADEQESLKI